MKIFDGKFDSCQRNGKLPEFSNKKADGLKIVESRKIVEREKVFLFFFKKREAEKHHYPLILVNN